MRFRLMCFVICVCVYICSYQNPAAAQSSSGNWVATWATAQDVAPTVADQPVLGPDVKRPDFSRMRRRTPPFIPTSMTDQTVRMIVHTSIPGRQVRIELTDAFGKSPVTISSAHIAVRKSESMIEPGTDRELTFGGSKSVTIRPGAVVVSDPADLDLKPLSGLAVSLYVQQSEGTPTNHVLGLHTSYVSDGNTAAAASTSEPKTATSYFWLKSVDVIPTKETFAIVCLGDSITDGAATTVDANSAWPALLAKRISETKGAPEIAVVNEGISGNEVLRDGAGVSALARFDRDVIGIPGVRWMILLEGINDINIHGQVSNPGALTAQDLIEGYRQLIAQAHMHGIKVMGATLTPDEGIWLAGPIGEATRQAVNQWIRTAHEFDAIVDFDAKTRDESHPTKLRAEFNSGDNIHPNDAGSQAMADAVPIEAFLTSGKSFLRKKATGK